MAHLYWRNLCFSSDERCVTLQPTTREPSDISCVNYALRYYSIDSYKIYLHTHSFSYAELIFPFKTWLPIILFRFLETNVCWKQSSHAMNVPLPFIILGRWNDCRKKRLLLQARIQLDIYFLTLAANRNLITKRIYSFQANNSVTAFIFSDLKPYD